MLAKQNNDDYSDDDCKELFVVYVFKVSLFCLRVCKQTQGKVELLTLATR